MPNSPSLKFKIENQNTGEVNVPSNGISMFLARTTKGEYNNPSVLIRTLTQFRDLFGSEIVPDGTPSNIEKALIGGSTLRIVRVPGSGYYKGILSASSTPPDPEDEEEEEDVPPTPETVLTLTDGTNSVNIGFYTRTYDELVDGVANFSASFFKQGNTIFCNITGYQKTKVLENMPVITFKNSDSVNNTTVDALAFYQFLTGSKYLEPVVIETGTTLLDKSIAGVANWLFETVDNSDLTLSFKVNNTEVSTTPVSCVSIPGSSGIAPTVTEWTSSLEYARDYADYYNLVCSHIDQHLSTSSDQLVIHKLAKEMADELDEFMYDIEVPKYTTHYSQGTTIRDKSSIITWVSTCLSTIGNSRNVAYFAGGCLMANSNGIIVNGDCLGSIIGIADKSASDFGPWKSFAGMNRGLLLDTKGPVCPNYGSPARYNDLNELAQSFVNMVVIKDTGTIGKQPMLWHCFTSQVKQDSFKFIAVNQLIHYLKKLIRPVIESKIEEPNYIPTWKAIYYILKPSFDELVTKEAVSEYTWNGDQNASGYTDMVVNNESDVRQGKYRANLVLKEIVPMQDIEIGIMIDKTTKTASFEVNNVNA